MAWRFYLVPKIGDGTPLFNPYRVKYLSTLSGVRYEAKDYGAEPWFLVAADVTDPQHTALVANSDVSAFPQNLDASVGANLATVQTALETVNMPGSWVQSSHTFRQVLAGVARVCRVAQKFSYNSAFVAARIFQSGITLDTTVAQLTQGQRDRLQYVADQLHLDYSGVTGATTMRQLLRGLAVQLPAIMLGPENLT